uniref:Capping protein inhibiting regulator of actin dynamics n=1 Tax=Scleropages formosus TaxID=113540 RepID=A0A8C9WJ84_SCLFO
KSDDADDTEGAVQSGFQAEPQSGLHSGSMRTPVKSPRSKRAPPAAGTIESVNLDSVPLLFSCLDSSAARHKLSVKPKNQRLSHKHRRFTQVRISGSDVTNHGAVTVPSIFSHFGLSILKKNRWEETCGSLFLQDTQNMCPTEGLQEESEAQSPAHTISNRSRAEGEAPSWSEDEHLSTFPEKSNKPKLQAETSSLDVDWRCVEQQETRRELESEGNIQNAEEEMKQKQRKGEELKVHETEERKRGEEKKVTLREEEETKRRKDEDGGEEQSRNEELRQQEMLTELQHLKGERLRTEEESRRKKKEEKRLHELEEQRVQRDREEEQQRQAEKKRMEEEEERQQQEQDKQLEEAEEQKCPSEVSPVEKARHCSEEGTQPKEWKRKAEELRWKEMEERQRPFTFKVSSGEKQILFQRVNLSPVTPSSQQGSSNESKLSKSPPVGSTESPTLPSSLFVPHTAILVTGAQLCGAAVNLDQIKDPACKSLLGLTEDKKAMGLPLNKGPGKNSPERKSTKTKSLNESSADQSSSAVLAEWATIRSKIFKRAENGSVEDKDTRHLNQPLSEDLSRKPVSVSHSNLRKTVSANAKFSITPARQKFPDSSKASEALNHIEKDGGNTKSSSPDTGSPPPVSPGEKSQSRVSKTVRILDRTEGCVFAKDLPSFLVPSPPHVSPRIRSQSEALSPADSDSSSDSKGQSSEDKASPFGIKLRRTNYSLRFRNDQPVEKRKKRYSAGDSFDGIPAPLTSIDADSDTSVLSDKSSPSSPLRNVLGAAVGRLSHVAVGCDSDRLLSRPMHHKPLVAPKPGSGTPPSSSQSPDDSAAPDSGKPSGDSEGGSGVPPTLFTVEVVQKPFLQSRHSLDSGAPEKEAGPLWITLALQKQKGFREQQQSREEHRHKREVRLAEKQSRERNDSSGMSSASTQKAPEGDRDKVDNPLSLFERREHLRKANTLPGSVTVEIADVATSAPPAKDSVKRFPSTEPVQVSTEPAWLALAKRKAKAWSDCPQIIK